MKIAVTLVACTFCLAADLLHSPSALAEECADVKERLFALGTTKCDELNYAGRANECIAFQTSKLEALKSLQGMDCPSAPSKFSWADQIGSTVFLIEQMKQYPNGLSGFVDLEEADRQSEGHAEKQRGKATPLQR